MLQKDVTAVNRIQYPVPYSGTWKSLPGHLIPESALVDSSNVFIKDGELVTRPGLGVKFGIGVLDGEVLGGGEFSNGVDRFLVAVTRSSVYTATSIVSNWNRIGGVSFDADKGVSFDLFSSSGVVYAIIASGSVVYTWDGTTFNTITSSLGVIPNVHDIEIAFDRIVAIEKPYNVRWTVGLDFTNWSDLNESKKPESGDEVVTIKKMTNLGFVLYKEKSIYIAFATAGPDSTAFTFRDSRGQYEAPAGIHAVVDVNGSHIYMTASGRIGLFTGAQHRWIADGIWSFMREDIDETLTYKIFGIYDRVLNTLSFVYPRGGEMVGLVVVNLPYPEIGIQGFSAFLGTLSVPVNYGFGFKLNNLLPQCIGFNSSDNQGYLFDSSVGNDAGLPFNCIIQTPIKPFESFKHNKVNVETFCERSDTYGMVGVNIVSSAMLDNRDGHVYSEMQRIDLNTARVNEFLGFNKSDRYFGVKYSWNSGLSVFKYKGAIVYGRDVG